MDGNAVRLAVIVLLAALLGFVVAVGTSPDLFTADIKYVNVTVEKEVRVVEYVPKEVEKIKEVNVTVNQTTTKTIVPNFMEAAGDIYGNKSYYLRYYPNSFKNRMNDDYLSLVRSRLGYDGRRQDGWLGDDLSDCATWSEIWVPVDAITGKMITPEDYKNYHEGACKTT